MNDRKSRLLEIFREYFSPTTAGAIVTVSFSRAKVDPGRPLSAPEIARLCAELARGLRLYLPDEARQAECLRRSQEALGAGERRPATNTAIPVAAESDIVRARSTGGDVCRGLGFSEGDQVRMATAISELARNIVQYASRGVITIRSMNEPRVGIEVTAVDQGPGIANIEHVMSDAYASRTGMGIGLKGTRRLVDHFEIQSQVGKGTAIRILKYLA